MDVVRDQSLGPHTVSRKRRDRPIVERFIENLRANHQVIDTIYFSLVIALSPISFRSIVHAFKPMDFLLQGTNQHANSVSSRYMYDQPSERSLIISSYPLTMS